jgi:microcystin-dependent protein
VLSAAGYPFGNGNGSTTFNLPDMRGRFPLGLNDFSQPTNSNLSLTNRELGQQGGDEDLQSHSHTYRRTFISQNLSTSGFADEGPPRPVDGVSFDDTSNSGSGNGGNMPPFLTLNFVIKT